MCFQHPNPLPGSIASNFTIPLRCVTGLSAAQIEARMLDALRETELLVEVGDRLHAGALTLSGGQQQRLCLARALALEPSCLLLDEPTASLDFRSSSKIEELLHRLKARYTIVAVSHNLSQARRLADQVAILREARWPASSIEVSWKTRTHSTARSNAFSDDDREIARAERRAQTQPSSSSLVSIARRVRASVQFFSIFSSAFA